MNGDKFEQYLKRQLMRPVPGAWRQEILKVAGGACPVPSAGGEGGMGWWREWLSFTRVAWSGVAVAWVAILTLNWAANRPGGPGSVEAVFSPSVVALALEQSREIAIAMERGEGLESGPVPRDRPRSARALDLRTV